MSKTLAQSVVLVLAAKRLTRLVTTDWIGEWIVVRPAKKWAYRHEGPVDVHLALVDVDGTVVDPTRGFWRTKAVSGLDCEWCVGVWAAALASLPMPQRVDRIRQPVILMLAVAQGVGMLGQLDSLGAPPPPLEKSMHQMEDNPS